MVEQSFENFKIFFEAIDDLIFITSEEGIILNVNKAVLSKLGYSKHELVGKHVIDVHPKEYEEQAKQIFGELILGTRDFCPLPLAKKSGSYLMVETRIWKGQWDGKNCVYGISKDLTVQNEATERFRQLFDCNPTLMAVSSIDDGRFIEVNQAFLDTLEYSREEVVGKRASELDLFKEPERQLFVREQLKLSGSVKDVEFTIYKKSGKSIQGLFSGEIIQYLEQKCLFTVMVDISEKRALEKMIKEKSEFEHMLINTVPSAVFSVNMNCEITSWNRRAAQITGFSKEEVIGKNCSLFALEPCRTLCGMKSDLVEKPVFGRRCTLQTKSGERITISKNVDLIRNLEGEPIGAIECFEDISQRSKTEQLLRESEERYAAIVNNAPEIVVIHQDQKIVFVNETSKRVTGYTDEDVLGKPALSFFTEATKRYLREIMKDPNKLEEIPDYEAEFIIKNGDIKSFMVKSIPISFNKRSSILSVLMDISDRKKFENEMLKKEELLTAVAKSIKQLLDVGDYLEAVSMCFEILGNATGVNRVYLFQNEYDENGNGYTSQKLEWNSGDQQPQLDNPELQNISFEDIDTFIEPLKLGQAFCGVVKDLENDRTRELLEEQDILSVVVLPIFVNRVFWGFIGFDECKYERKWTEGEFSTLSAFANSLESAIERNLVEEELRISKIAAEAANVMKSQFLANMSHEIRTPINGIMGFLDLLERTQLSYEQIDYIKEAKAASDILIYLINDILDFSKIEAGRLLIEQTIFSPLKVIEEAVSLLIPRANEKKIGIQIHVVPGLPKTIIGDPARFRQVVNNLLSNAIKFTDIGEITVTISSEKTDGGDVNISVCVRDTGIGMSKEVMEQLFSPFMQADSSTTRKYGGTGLGLAISHELVHLMKGEMSVESTEGEGSTFSFSILAKYTHHTSTQEEGVCEQQAKSETISIETMDLHNAPRILVVEDNEINRKIVFTALRYENYSCDIAADGKQALEEMKAKEYDIVFMDCQMPIMDGYESTREIRKYEDGRRHTYIVAMTANAMEGDEEKCYEAGMDDYLSKPIDINRIYEKVRIGMSFKSKNVDFIQNSMRSFMESSGFSENITKELFGDFSRNFVSLMKDIETALKQYEWDIVSRAAHQIKGASGSLKIDAIARLSKNLDEASKQRKESECREYYGLLKQYIFDGTEE